MGDMIKNRDIYGQPINLNYQGDDSFRTIPGGILSIILLGLVLCYSFIKGKYMINKEQWQITQQTVAATELDLMAPKQMNDS